MTVQEAVINPLRLSREKPIPPTGLLAVNPTDMRLFAQTAYPSQAKRHPLFHAGLHVWDSFFFAGPAVGAPMAVLTMEKLIALGAKTILLYGWCGALVPSLQVGDILLPTSFLSEEGTSCHYPVDDPAPDPALCTVLWTTLQGMQWPCHRGPIWTTDAPYRETRDKVQRYGESGILGVDMEFSALCTVAAFRKIRFAGLLLVSDLLYRPDWKAQYGKRSFLERSTQLMEMLCNLLTLHPFCHHE